MCIVVIEILKVPESFANGWDINYHLLKNNCQHFAIALQEFLTTGVCSVLRSENNTTDLNQQINDILQNCSIVCFDNEGNSVVSIHYI